MDYISPSGSHSWSLLLMNITNSGGQLSESVTAVGRYDAVLEERCWTEPHDDRGPVGNDGYKEQRNPRFCSAGCLEGASYQTPNPTGMEGLCFERAKMENLLPRSKEGWADVIMWPGCCFPEECSAHTADHQRSSHRQTSEAMLHQPHSLHQRIQTSSADSEGAWQGEWSKQHPEILMEQQDWTNRCTSNQTRTHDKVYKRWRRKEDKWGTQGQRSDHIQVSFMPKKRISDCYWSVKTCSLKGFPGEQDLQSHIYTGFCLFIVSCLNQIMIK